jgi:hypothetical protein
MSVPKHLLLIRGWCPLGLIVHLMINGQPVEVYLSTQKLFIVHRPVCMRQKWCDLEQMATGGFCKLGSS